MFSFDLASPALCVKGHILQDQIFVPQLARNARLKMCNTDYRMLSAKPRNGGTIFNGTVAHSRQILSWVQRDPNPSSPVI